MLRRSKIINSCYVNSRLIVNSYRPFSFSKNNLDEIFGSSANGEKIDFTNKSEIMKNLFVEHPKTKSVKQETITKIMNDNQIMISDPVIPITEFDHLGVDGYITKYLNRQYEKPTPIQMFSWPLTLSGKNIVGVSITGSGKTLSFGVPMIYHILKNKKPDERKTLGLVILPSWELAKQVGEELKKIGNDVNINGAVFVGGESSSIQLRNHRKNNDYIVATPGRLIDYLSKGIIDLSDISYFVLDEADRMMDMGFEPQIRKIFEHIRPDRQCTMWSATWPKKVSLIANNFIKDAAKIKVGKGIYVANPNIEQRFEFLNPNSKVNTLERILKSKEFKDKKIMIFCNTILSVDFLENKLSNNGMSVVGLHGKKETHIRRSVYLQYKRNDADILVATDVASRGIDVDNVDLVVLYDFPTMFENYIHRIGRTGRRHRPGVSISMLTKFDVNYAKNLIKVLELSKQKIPEQLEKIAKFER